MEFVEGEDLSRRLSRGPMPLDEALAVARQIADALQAAHEKGIVHRDLKPANIMLTRDGAVKVLDFGLATVVSDRGGSPAATESSAATAAGTRTGVIVGTAAYMSPEQARGQPIDRRCDLWSFGAVVFEMLTGRRAFAGDTVSDTVANVLTKDPDWLRLPELSDPVHRLLRRCLQKDRNRRLDSAAAARFDLEDAIAGPLAAPRSGATMRRGLRAATAATLVAGLAFAGAAGWTLMRQRPSTPQEPSRFVIVPSPVPLVMGPVERAIAVSPDGSYIAYTTGGYTGVGPFMLRRVEQLEAQVVAGVDSARDPFFSPDSRWIGFFDRGTLKKIPVGGGAAISICPNPGNLGGSTWLQDDTIVFGSGDSGNGLFRVRASGGEPTAITTPDKTAGEQEHVLPFALPGQRGVLFTVRGNGGRRSVAVLDLQSGSTRVLVPNGSDAQYVAAPPGAPSDGYLVYAVDGALHGVTFDLAGLQAGLEPFPLVPSVQMAGGGAANYAVNAAGTLYYVPGGIGLRSLVWVDRGGAETVIPAAPGVYSAPRLAPNGQRAVLTLDGDLWLWDFARTSLTRLADKGGFAAWTPDSRRVVFHSRGDTYIQAADGSAVPVRLTESFLPNSVTPDGQVVLGSRLSTGTSYDVVSYPLAALAGNTNRGESAANSPRLQALVATPRPEFAASLSPNGRYLLYQISQGNRYDVIVRPFPGVNDGHWQVSTAGGDSPLWSGSGRELFYFEPSGAMMAVPVNTSGSTFQSGRPVKLFDAKSYDRDLFGYDVSSDAQRFLMLKKHDQALHIVVVLNWRTEVHRLFSGNAASTSSR